MKWIVRAAFYTALLLSASGASADVAAATALREGDMKKLNFHSEARAGSDAVFTDLGGTEMTLAQFQGKIVVLNFWATWCAPCRKEMPMLANLQTEFSGSDLEVVTIATGRNPPQAITRFFGEIGVDNLPSYIDPKQRLAREMAVLGLPVTIILDAQGRELGRLTGDAKWDSPSAIAVLKALIDEGS